jgi:hypothetical protein
MPSFLAFNLSVCTIVETNAQSLKITHRAKNPTNLRRNINCRHVRTKILFLLVRQQPKKCL